MRAPALFALVAACSSLPVAPPDLAVDKAARCTGTFGSALTAPYGRLDGAELTQMVTDRLAPDAPVSVFASTSGGDSAHLVHRNLTDQDGAIVVDPTGAPLYLLFAFADQSF